MVLEIWEAISEVGKKYYFIINTITFSVYTKNPDSGILFFLSREKAKKELEKIKEDNTIGYWLGG